MISIISRNRLCCRLSVHFVPDRDSPALFCEWLRLTKGEMGAKIDTSPAVFLILCHFYEKGHGNLTEFHGGPLIVMGEVADIEKAKRVC